MALGGRHADAVITLTPIQLRGFARVVPQHVEHRGGGRQQPVLTGRGGELGEPRPEDEAPLHVARHEAVVLEGDGEAVGRRTGEVRRVDELGKGRGPGLEGTQDGRGFVQDADSTRVVHGSILPSH